MKKFLKYVLAGLVLPCVLLAGCGGDKLNLKTEAFADNSLIYDNLIDYTQDVRDFETLSADYTKSLNTDAKQKETLAWNLVNKINKNFIFVMPALDMRINNRLAWSYDLTTVSPTLSEFSLVQTTSETTAAKTYLYYYNTNIYSFDQNSPLPQPVTKTPYTTDDVNVENEIKKMGLVLKYKVTPTTDYQVEITPEFVYPTEAEVSASVKGSVATGNYFEIARNDDTKTIQIIYQKTTNIIARKDISFKTDDTTGKVRKIVSYYECTDPNTDPLAFAPVSSKNYEYTFQESELIGTYKNLKVFQDTGYFRGEQVITNQISNKLEFYMLKDGNIMANYNAKENTNIETVELLIYNGASNAKLKYKSGSHKIESIEEIFKNKKEQSFTKITEAEKAASTKTYRFNYENTEVRVTTT